MSVKKWVNYYDKLDSLMSPNEYLIKVLLGNYPKKTSFLNSGSWREEFKNIKCLDLSCGDGRNIILLDKLGFDYYGTEVNKSICEKVIKNLKKNNVSISKDKIRVCLNSKIPFKDHFFKYLISWNGIYYMNHENDSIEDYFKEVSRVLEKNAHFICSVPARKCYSYSGSIKISKNIVKIKPNLNSKWGNNVLDNSIFYYFNSKSNLKKLLTKNFYNLQISELFWDGFGVPLHYYIFIAQKR